MINNFKIKLVSSLGILTLVALLCFSCDTNLVEEYDQFIPENVLSIAKPDSVATLPTDYNKLTFKVFVNADPKVKKAVITYFDDDLSDDDDKIVATIDINRTTYKHEVYEVEVDMPEGGNEFFVHFENSRGEKGIKYDVFGTSLGDEHIASLQARLYSDVRVYSETEAVIYWESNRRTIQIDEEDVIIVVDDLLVDTEITYTSSVDGLEKTIVIDESEDTTIIPDFISEGTFTYKTFYRVDGFTDIIYSSNPTEGTFPVKI